MIRFILILLCFVASPVFAQDTVDLKDIEKAEQYLQDLKTAQARFVQTTHNGAQLSGTFYLKRPGKMRFEYDLPVKDFVVADGLFIHYYDAELEEQTNAPIRSTLAHFFLRKNFSLTDDLIVKDARYNDAGLLLMQVVQAKEPEAGSITFGFRKEPFELVKWRVIDAQAQITEVELFHLKTGMKHDPKLFLFVDPNKKSRQAGYND